MKKSARVSLVFLSSFAAAVMNGCGGDDDGNWVEAKRCVDNNNVVVEDRLCDDQARSGSGHVGRYHSYYYGGHGYYAGDRAYGGGTVAQPGVNYTNASRVPRGGFGSTGKAFVSRGGSISS
jgi:hypothetical protein